MLMECDVMMFCKNSLVFVVGCSPERKSNGVSGSESDASTRVREESGPCVALLVCLVNK